MFSFPVFHGGSYVCLGFCVLGKQPLLIITDCTDVPRVVLKELKKVQWEVRHGNPSSSSGGALSCL